MADKPIIFSAPMVRALLDGRKRMTRRLVPKLFQDEESLTTCVNSKTGKLCYAGTNPQGVDWIWDVSPYLRYAPGDRLYVREHWRTADAYDDLSPSQMGGEEPVIYLADDTLGTWGWRNDFVPGRFRQAMHMPRHFSRITLTVTDVRVQRLQEISEADAVAEGIEQARSGRFYDPTVSRGTAAHLGGMHHGARSAYEALWNSLHGPHAWDANPWVAAYSFAVQHGNIDTQGDPQ